MANNLYNVTALTTAITHALAGTPNANNPPLQIINRSLQYMSDLRPWLWRQKPFSLDFTANAISTMTRVSSTITVTTTLAHGLIVGLPVAISGSIGSTTTPFNGSFTVASVASATVFTVVQSGNPPDDVATTPGTWLGGFAPLPADFSQVWVLKSATNSFRDVMPTSMEDLISRRQFAYGSSYELFYCVSYLPQTTLLVEPQPILQLFPTPTVSLAGALQGVYLRRIPALVNGTDMPDIPSPFHELLLVLCRALAVSTEEDQMGTDWALFDKMLPTFAAEDGMMQGSRFARMVSTLHSRTYPVSQFYPNGRITA